MKRRTFLAAFAAVAGIAATSLPVDGGTFTLKFVGQTTSPEWRITSQHASQDLATMMVTIYTCGFCKSRLGRIGDPMVATMPPYPPAISGFTRRYLAFTQVSEDEARFTFVDTGTREDAWRAAIALTA